jgi:hypothetical protein
LEEEDVLDSLDMSLIKKKKTLMRSKKKEEGAVSWRIIFS